MNTTRTIFHAQRRPWDLSIGLGIAMQIPGDKLMVATHMTVQSLEPGELAPEPVLKLTHEDAQALMDELWQVGLRPTEGTGSAGALAATQKHLEDMQAIAIGLLRRDGVDL